MKKLFTTTVLLLSIIWTNAQVTFNPSYSGTATNVTMTAGGGAATGANGSVTITW